MSARIKEKVLRLPCDRMDILNPWEFAKKHRDCFSVDEEGMFRVAPTVRPFIDYVLESFVTNEESYGESRELSPQEQQEYAPVFKRVFSEIDMDLVRMVEYVWYDATEAPDYYLPSLTKELPLVNIEALKTDADVKECIEQVKKILGKTGQIQQDIKKAHIFVEAEREDVCHMVMKILVSFLKERGYCK
ncbi:MAG: hypothetical protein J6Z00_03925 [Clostridia bacterium]|nr:hypothetical protein [Clostridia bacterium]